MSEEIDDLSSTLREFKDENEEEVKFLRNKLVSRTSKSFQKTFKQIEMNSNHVNLSETNGKFCTLDTVA